MKKLNVITGAVCILLSLFVIQSALHFEETLIGNDYTGPAFFPNVTSGIMIALSLVLILSSLFFMPKEVDTPLNPANLKSPLVGIGVMFCYILALEPVGFIVATAAMIAVMLMIFRVRKVHMLVLYPVFLSVLVYVVFRKLLMIDLPEGVLHF